MSKILRRTLNSHDGLRPQDRSIVNCLHMTAMSSLADLTHKLEHCIAIR